MYKSHLRRITLIPSHHLYAVLSIMNVTAIQWFHRSVVDSIVRTIQVVVRRALVALDTITGPKPARSYPHKNKEAVENVSYVPNTKMSRTVQYLQMKLVSKKSKKNWT